MLRCIAILRPEVVPGFEELINTIYKVYRQYDFVRSVTPLGICSSQEKRASAGERVAFKLTIIQPPQFPSASVMVTTIALFHCCYVSCEKPCPLYHLCTSPVGPIDIRHRPTLAFLSAAVRQCKTFKLLKSQKPQNASYEWSAASVGPTQASSANGPNGSALLLFQATRPRRAQNPLQVKPHATC